MDPYQQYQGPSQGNPYEFILNPAKPPKKKRFGFGGNLALTLGLIVGGAFIFMIVLAMILNAFAPKKVSTQDLIGLAQTQNELIRISDQASKDAVHQSTNDLASTIQYSMTTQQLKTLQLLAKNGTELGEKELTLKQNATTDQQFASAKSTSTFDLVFAQVVQNELTQYANDLKQLHSVAKSKTERDLMSSYHEQTQLLISQIPYTQDKIESAGQ